MSWKQQIGSTINDLQWDQGIPQGEFVKLVETAFPIFIYEKMPFAFSNTPLKFRFRVRAKNGCGWGEASDALEVIKSTVPGEISYFSTTARGCGLNI